MQRLDRLPSLDFANERRGDVFTLEFPNRWDARQARRAAELTDRPRASLTRRALVQGLERFRRGGAATEGRLTDDLRRAVAPGK